MQKEKQKVFILSQGGCERLLELLSESDLVEIVGVYVEKAHAPKRTFRQKLERSIKYDGYWETLKKFSAKIIGGKTEGAEELRDAQDKQKNLDQMAERLGIPLFQVENYHSNETKETLRRLDADLGVFIRNEYYQKSCFSDS